MNTAPNFFQLSSTDRRGIITKGASELGKDPVVLEKDVWVCWVLERLFSMPGRLKMAFKGGTSLSKVFNAIHRFSEDVDVTLDFRAWGDDLPTAQSLSRNKRKGLSEKLKERVREHTQGVVLPYFQEEVASCIGEGGVVELDETGEKLRIGYATVFDDSSGYMRDSVLVEFGGRNLTEPKETHTVRPYIVELGGAFSLPQAEVDVLSPQRTFWEKATLIHVTCQAGYDKSAKRQSRHWYDLHMLSQTDIGERALADRDLLQSVVAHKDVFFYTGKANYDACLKGSFALVPGKEWAQALRDDYAEMMASGMFWANPPDFDVILACLESVEKRINR